MMRKATIMLVILIVAIASFPIVWRQGIKRYYQPNIFNYDTAPNEQASIVFGAAVYRDGRLSSVLRDRMDTAVALYSNGSVDKIVVSGAKRTGYYDEPGSMRTYALQRGVPANAILADYEGNRTYDTCYRAKHVFQIESALLVTQDFHLPRALFTCNQLGLEANGIAADMRTYRGSRWYEFRETVATVLALWDILWQQAPYVLDAPIYIN